MKNPSGTAHAQRDTRARSAWRSLMRSTVSSKGQRLTMRSATIVILWVGLTCSACDEPSRVDDLATPGAQSGHTDEDGAAAPTTSATQTGGDGAGSTDAGYPGGDQGGGGNTNLDDAVTEEVVALGDGSVVEVRPLEPLQAPPTPTNCEHQSESSDAVSCRVQSTCDSFDYVQTECTGTSGLWGCHCWSAYFEETFEVNADTASEACAAASELCSSEQRPALSEDVTCSVTGDASPESCQMLQSCSNSVEIGDITVNHNGQTPASCTRAGTDAFRCECGDDFDGIQSFLVTGADAEESCQTILDVCTAEHAPALDGPKLCELQAQESTPEQCYAGFECQYPSDGIEGVARLGWEGSSCQDPGDGTLNCSCDNSDRAIDMVLPGPLSEIDECLAAREICANADQIVVADALECVPSNQASPSERWCTGTLQCTQGANLGEQQFSIRGEVDVDCKSEGAGSGWRCSCASRAESKSFEIEESLSGWDACGVATTYCPTLLDERMFTSFRDGVPRTPEGLPLY